jgi:hypothetical protein
MLWIPDQVRYDDKGLFANASNIGQHPLDTFGVATVQHCTLPQTPLQFRGFFRQNMTGKGLVTNYFTAAGAFKAFSGPTVCFHFWHNLLS